MPQMAERIGQASGEAVGRYVMSRPEVKKAVKEVTNAAKWVAIIGEKADKVLTPLAEIADLYDGKGGIIKGILEKAKGAMTEGTTDSPN